ncbi:hypothetical protein G7K_5946-t1 [Saitoella complicata NRRL Y-17804]|uniref:Uncharacterized protein n=1 Tax=Saitoella complicata (strain BCRC 22490 / CBS 7301 / JCM 7358 / NBRC 10748 / NRRL Y-17804) TaxID=698492 RepID=A0A0E9NR05_SAICN|nr:hypothetical protein G7K_5946-t1 [Saitoella complicata NRRL Y-17804]
MDSWSRMRAATTILAPEHSTILLPPSPSIPSDNPNNSYTGRESCFTAIFSPRRHRGHHHQRSAFMANSASLRGQLLPRVALVNTRRPCWQRIRQTASPVNPPHQPRQHRWHPLRRSPLLPHPPQPIHCRCSRPVHNLPSNTRLSLSPPSWYTDIQQVSEFHEEAILRGTRRSSVRLFTRRHCGSRVGIGRIRQKTCFRSLGGVLVRSLKRRKPRTKERNCKMRKQGLTRVRRFHQDNAHSFCTPTQIASENADTLRFVHAVFTVFQLPSYEFLSTRPETFIGGLGEWEQAEDALKEALDTIPLDGNGRRRKAMDQRSTSYSKTGRLIPATTAADVIAYAEAVQRRLSGISTTTEPVPPTPTLELATRTFSVDIDASEGKPLSKAQKRRANFTLVVGQKEMKNGTVTVRNEGWEADGGEECGRGVSDAFGVGEDVSQIRAPGRR